MLVDYMFQYTNIEKWCQLSQQIEIYYIVDGYHINLFNDDGQTKFLEYQAETIEQVLRKVDIILGNMYREGRLK